MRKSKTSNGFIPTPAQQRRVPYSWIWGSNGGRGWAACLVFINVHFALFGLSMRYIRHLMGTAGPFALTVAATVFVSTMLFFTEIWQRHVAAKVSWVLGAIAWLLNVILALTGYFG
jgi:hypothetical protein